MGIILLNHYCPLTSKWMQSNRTNRTSSIGTAPGTEGPQREGMRVTPQVFPSCASRAPSSVRWVSGKTTKIYLFHMLPSATVYIVFYSVFKRGRYSPWHRCGSYRECSNLSKVAQLRTSKAPIGAHLAPGSLWAKLPFVEVANFFGFGFRSVFRLSQPLSSVSNGLCSLGVLVFSIHLGWFFCFVFYHVRLWKSEKVS